MPEAAITSMDEYIDRYWPGSPQWERMGRKIALLIADAEEADAVRALDYARQSWLRAHHRRGEER